MQALIDFDGWRKWKDFADKSESKDSTSKLSASYHSVAPKKSSTAPSPTVANSETNGIIKKDDDTKEKERDRKNKRKSVGIIPQPSLPEEVETPPDVDSGAN
jgi:osomolarity two-component system, response regulator SSK1